MKLNEPIYAVESLDTSPATQLWQAMANAGIEPPDALLFDSEFHRFGKNGRCWYKAHDGNPPVAIFGDWALGINDKLICDTGKEYSQLERWHTEQGIKQMREDIKAKAMYSAGIALQTWEKATPASADHPYLEKKQIQPHGTRVASDGRLMVPLYLDGEIVSMQYIAADSEKRYQKGTSTKGAWHILGEPEGKIFIAEGFATAATIYEETGIASVVAFSAGNLPSVTEAVRDLYPLAQITIVADLDESGIGKNYAEQAAAKYGARVIVSPATTDVNDYRQQGGDVHGLLMVSENKFEKVLISPDSLNAAFMDTLNTSWIIKGLLPESSGLTMIYGAPGTYKSFLSIDMALSIANGISWHGKRVKQKTVLYIAAEGQHGVLKRMEAWRQYHKIDKLENIYILPIPAKLDDYVDVANLIETIKNLPECPEFIFFDTLARSMNGHENDTKDMSNAVDSASMIYHSIGTQVVLIHHTGKDPAKGPRGNTSLPAATDTQFLVTKIDDYQAVLTCERQKDDALGDPIGFNLKLIDTGYKNIDGDIITSLVPVADYDVKTKSNKRDFRNEWIKSFEDAWIKSGTELVNDLPYLTRSAWADWLVESKAKKNINSALQAVKATGKGMASKLLDEGIIRNHASGYLMQDEDAISVLMLLVEKV